MDAGATTNSVEEEILMQIVAAENLGGFTNPFGDPSRRSPHDEAIARALMDDYLPSASSSRLTLRKLFKERDQGTTGGWYASRSPAPRKDPAEKLEALKTGEQQRQQPQEPKEEDRKPGEIYIWGQAIDGQLGLGNKKAHQLQPTMVKKLVNKSIRMIACGKNHTVALADNGDVYTWGSGICGQLGHNKRGLLPTIVSSIQGVNVRAVHCGWSHTVCLTDMGKVLTFGLNDSGELGLGTFQSPRVTPSVVESLEAVTIVSIACGASHTLAISAEGNLYAWGRNDNLQLGLTHRENIHTPALVRKLFRKKCVQAAGGVAHSAVVTESGRVWTFGRGKHGRLGHGDVADKQPTIVKAFEFKKIVSVACGWQHTCAIDTEGLLYTWGCGRQGQLGHGDRNDQKLPKLLNTDEVYKTVVCGERHMAAITDGGVCYIWGHGAAGKLGIGTVDQDALVPALVGDLHTRYMRQIALGGNHSAALVGNQLALAMDMRKLLNSQEFSDITLIVEDRPIYAHKVILACRSPVFRTILSSGVDSSVTEKVRTEPSPQSQSSGEDNDKNVKKKPVPKELVISDTPHAVVFALLEYIYTDSTHITAAVVDELLIAAIEFQLPRLAKLCAAFMKEKGFTLPDSVEGIEKEGDKINSLEDDIFMSLKTCKEFADIVFKIHAPTSDKKKHTKTEEKNEDKLVDKAAEDGGGKEKEEKGKEKEKEQEKETKDSRLVDKHEEFRFLYAHKCILAARSDYFKVMFAAGMKESDFSLDFANDVEEEGAEEVPDIPTPSFDAEGKEAEKKEGGDEKGKEKVKEEPKTFAGLLAERSIPIEGVSFESFGQITKFIYSGKVKITPQSVMELLMASNQYRLSALKQLATGFIEEHISTENVIEILVMADHFSFARLSTFALDYAAKHLEKVKSDTPEDVWNTIPAPLLEKLENPNKTTRVKKDPGFRWKPDQTVHVLEQDLYGIQGATYSDLKVSKALATAISQARGKKGYSRRDLARKLAIKETILADYEAAKTIPNMSLIKKLEGALGCPLAHLVPKVAAGPRKRNPTDS